MSPSVMISHKNAANAFSGKTARACDNCIQKRARWYCAADDAFLCQSCDRSVHSANPLARRHERVRLKTAATSQKHLGEFASRRKSSSWHRGFTKKPRTPRGTKSALQRASKPENMARVPEVGGDETSNEESEEHLLYRVPAYDPFVAEMCTSKGAEAAAFCADPETAMAFDGSGKGDNRSKELTIEVENLQGFLPSDADLAEFAADVESLLGRGLDAESFGIEGLGFVDCKQRGSNSMDYSLGSGGVIKLEEKEGVAEVDVEVGHGDVEIDLSKETFELNFDYDSPTTCGDEEEEAKVITELEEEKNVENCRGDEGTNINSEERKKKKKKKREVFLRLDYEAVMSAWAGQGSPWTTGDRPDLSPDNRWPDFTGMSGLELQNLYGEAGAYGGHMGMGDALREAKVSRYREKRRTRLFSKKIRYEVRKLNAEKRPRMKGRFVKRASSASSSAPGFPLLNK
ncbi:zinc finger protein CONSTANS-LIKE 16-like [Rhodamnia argentea]|uniref:Zinc finger protein CONSTANS-LIKE 16-like n=1 Tax=Rhodamnia argentea TaxID=178133 RepID=A0A8B8QG18_9MYRT|nr:zinc finger protein CONSTANS-LIKE 16-like [Rhodamnia argentea]